jgi:hypothetical protein
VFKIKKVGQAAEKWLHSVFIDKFEMFVKKLTDNKGGALVKYTGIFVQKYVKGLIED